VNTLFVALPRAAVAALLAAGASLLLADAANADVPLKSLPGGADPLRSPNWSSMHIVMLDGGPYQFDDQVQVLAPTAAENPANVPVMVRLDPALGDIERLVVFADLNPIQKVLEYYPTGPAGALGLRLKLEQASPVRAAALTADGIWHVGGTWIDAAGGGCTAPSTGRAAGNWAETLGDVTYRAWKKDDLLTRLRVRVMHPMDTGLAPGVPPFYIDEIMIQDSEGQVLGRLLTYQPISENPFFTFDFANGVSVDQGVHFLGRDINGNRFEATIQ
jgi:sulfur-oxidizing protein SoxY